MHTCLQHLSQTRQRIRAGPSCARNRIPLDRVCASVGHDVALFVGENNGGAEIRATVHGNEVMVGQQGSFLSTLCWDVHFFRVCRGMVCVHWKVGLVALVQMPRR